MHWESYTLCICGIQNLRTVKVVKVTSGELLVHSYIPSYTLHIELFGLEGTLEIIQLQPPDGSRVVSKIMEILHLEDDRTRGTAPT